jgi:hypothetical protein
MRKRFFGASPSAGSRRPAYGGAIAYDRLEPARWCGRAADPLADDDNRAGLDQTPRSNGSRAGSHAATSRAQPSRDDREAHQCRGLGPDDPARTVVSSNYRPSLRFFYSALEVIASTEASAASFHFGIALNRFP